MKGTERVNDFCFSVFTLTNYHKFKKGKTEEFCHFFVKFISGFHIIGPTLQTLPAAGFML